MPRWLRRVGIFVLVLLLIEWLDEFVFGARDAAWPLIRDELHLDYNQIGLLLSVPLIVASFIEPMIGILGDMWKRRVLVIGGGIAMAIALFLTALTPSYWVLMVALIVMYPASGSFVNLAQATLMDSNPARHEHNMARWTFAGSVGVTTGALGLGLLVALGFGWRPFFLITAAISLILALVLLRWRFPTAQSSQDEEEGAPLTFWKGAGNALRALRRREVVRWLTLLEFSDLMLDVLYGYLALYFVDVVGVRPEVAGIAVTVWTGVGLLGDFLLIPLLERVRGLSYLRISAWLELILFPVFLLSESLFIKLITLGLLGFFNAGWYSILKGQLYSAMPGQSGTVMAIGNVSGLIGATLPFMIGLLAEHFGLGIAMWVLMLGPIALIIGLPRTQSTPATSPSSQPEDAASLAG